MRNGTGDAALMRYLVCGAHEDVVGDLAEGQTQVDHIVLGAAALREVTDVHDAPGTRLPRYKLQAGERRNSVITSTGINVLLLTEICLSSNMASGKSANIQHEVYFHHMLISIK